MTLFDSSDDHDPKGKVRLKLRGDVVGTASISACRRYRHSLSRKWGDGPYVLWIGANPSVADSSVDDPTVQRETGFTNLWGYKHYVKCNAMDFRATYPKDLLADGVEPCSPENIPTIRKLAEHAQLVVICHGVLHKSLAHHGTAVVDALREDGHKLWCLGTTKGGQPKHPLYLRSDTGLERF